MFNSRLDNIESSLAEFRARVLCFSRRKKRRATNPREVLLGRCIDNHFLPEVGHFVTGIMIFGFLWRVFLSVEIKKYTVIKFFNQSNVSCC